MRIYALYSARVKVFVFLAVLFVAELTSELWIVAKICMSFQIVTEYSDLFSGCPVATKLRTITVVAWAPHLCTSTIVFAMMLHKFIQMIPVGKQKVPRNVFSIVPPVVERFMTDGTIFYFILFALNLLCMIFSATVNAALGRLAPPWIIAVYSHCAATLVLNLRMAARGLVVQTDGNSSQVFSPMNLTNPPNLHRAAVPAGYPYVAFHTSNGDLVVTRDIELETIDQSVGQ